MRYLVISTFLLLTIILAGCNEEPQKSLWSLKPRYEVLPDPTITSVLPANGAYAGIDEVTIIGTNFVTDVSKVKVYFENVPAKVTSATQTEIKVIAPVIAGDSLIVKVQIDGAIQYASYEPGYKVEFAEGEFGGITGQSNAYGIAIDLDDNLYVSLGEGKIVKIDQDGNQEDYVTAEQGVDGFYSAMKIGPGGDLYAARTKYIYKAPAGGGLMYKFTVTKLKQAINDIDFGPYGDIYVAAKKGIYFVQLSDSSGSLAMEYNNFTLNAIRVYDGYVYVAGSYTSFTSTPVKEGIWRNQILGPGGQLGATELVIDWEHSFDSPAFPKILALTFAEDGYMYIGADSTENADAVTVIPPNGNNSYSISDAYPLYQAVLMPPSTEFCWGNDQYLYVNRKNLDNDLARIIKITMGKMSAPYYGRK